ncbi:MAG: RNA methyltransferase [bacterium]|nr:MAG: RNA methyltransferase [bacterium]
MKSSNRKALRSPVPSGGTDEWGPAVSSPRNPRIRAAVLLRKRSERDRTGRMLIEGIRELRLAVRAGVSVRETFFCPELFKTDEEHGLLHELAGRNIDCVRVARRAFAKLAYREGTGGFVAVAERPERMLEGLATGTNPLILVVDAVEKPGNLGAILRTADAAGVTGLIVSNPRTDLTNPNVVRASLGTVFTVPWVQSPAAEAVKWLKDKGIAIVTTTPAGDAVPYTDADLHSPCAIVVGSEDTGAGTIWLEASDVRVRIPMQGQADSLNVSVSASIILYEALRQRRAP